MQLLTLPVRLAVRIHHSIILMSANAAVGGQAVMEGVMMRSPGHWAVAVRRSNGEIVDVTREVRPWARRFRWARLPVLRGIVALGGSLVIGFRALHVSAHYAAYDILNEEEACRTIDEWRERRGLSSDEAEQEHVERLAKFEGVTEQDFRLKYLLAEAPKKQQRAALAELFELERRCEAEEREALPSNVVSLDAHRETPPDASNPEDGASPEGLKTWQIAIAFIFALGFTIALFKLTPVALTKLFGFEYTSEGAALAVFIEGSIRIGIFCSYLALMGLMPDMKRVFQYHSAEHKAINAWENGVDLEPEKVNAQNRIHVRCGTAFMLWVFVVAYFVFLAFSRVVEDPALWQIVLSRIVFLPFIAGISFELIKFAGRFPNSRALRAILAPGLWLQYLTTRECTPEQCEVAIRSLEVVLHKEYPEAHTVEEALDESSSEDVEVLA